MQLVVLLDLRSKRLADRLIHQHTLRQHQKIRQPRRVVEQPDGKPESQPARHAVPDVVVQIDEPRARNDRQQGSKLRDEIGVWTVAEEVVQLGADSRVSVPV